MFGLIKSTVKVPACSVFSNKVFKNDLFYAMVVVFNMVSRSRIKEVGPDRACAEWLMRNGAFVKWTGSSEFVQSYNNLPLDPEDKGVFQLKEVDASFAAISHHGFPHFDGCKHVDKIKLISCYYVENKAISLLSYLQNSLEELEIIDCHSVSDEGLKTLKNLGKLKILKLAALPSVRDITGVVTELKKELPGCDVQVYL